MTNTTNIQRHSRRSSVLVRQNWPAIIGAVMALIVAFTGVARPPLWTDEAATISAAGRDFDAFSKLISSVDVVHGLYYMLMMPWMELFGTSTPMMRTPAALSMGAGAFFTVLITMNYVRPVAPQRTSLAGVIAGIFFAVLPGLAWMGFEARGYAFGTTCVLLAWWSYEKWLATRNRRWLVPMITMHLLGIYFILFAAMIVPLYVARALAYNKRTIVQAFGAATAIGIGTLPLVLMAIPQQGQVSWITTTPLSMVKKMASKQFFIGENVSHGPWYDVLIAIAILLAVLTVILLIVGVIVGPLRAVQVWLWTWILFPMLILLAVRLAGGDYYYERYLMFTTPALAILLAIVTTVCISRLKLGMLSAALLSALCLPAVIAQHGDSKNDSDFRSVSALLERASTIYYLDPASRDATTAYPHDKPATDPMLTVSPEESGSLWGENRPKRFAFDQTPSGIVAVASSVAADRDALVEDFILSGCTVEDSFPDKWTHSTLLNCPIR